MHSRAYQRLSNMKMIVPVLGLVISAATTVVANEHQQPLISNNDFDLIEKYADRVILY